MAKNEAQVMEFVTKELQKDPKAKTVDLYEGAKAVDASVKKLSLRQFNARYPLQVKRRKVAAAGGRKRRGPADRRGGRRGAQHHREAVRDVFLRFAGDLTAADEKKDLVKVLAGIDRYVDDAIAATGRKPRGQ